MKENDIAPTQTIGCRMTTSSAAVLISEDGNHFMKIRKLKPLECWRLMEFDDTDFYKAKQYLQVIHNCINKLEIVLLLTCYIEKLDFK